MATVSIILNTDNDAFYDNETLEVARILRALADRIEGEALSAIDEARLRDINGNTCGNVSYSND